MYEEKLVSEFTYLLLDGTPKKGFIADNRYLPFAISANLITVFQFLVVADIFNLASK